MNSGLVDGMSFQVVLKAATAKELSIDHPNCFVVSRAALFTRPIESFAPFERHYYTSNSLIW
jgi:hypothetical protein